MYQKWPKIGKFLNPKFDFDVLLQMSDSWIFGKRKSDES